MLSYIPQAGILSNFNVNDLNCGFPTHGEALKLLGILHR